MTGSAGLFETKKQGDFMIQKSLFHIVAMLVIAIILTACGGKGIDRKLNYSGTEKELGESYGEAMADATPEQQNVLRVGIHTVMPAVLLLAKNSNPANVEAVLAKKNAEEFDRVKKMSVRELFAWYLGKRQNELNKSVKLLSGNALKVESVSIVDVDAKEITANTNNMFIKGVISIRNDSDDTRYKVGSCQLYLVIDGKQIEKNHPGMNGLGGCDAGGRREINSKGGKETFEFSYRIPGNEDIKTFFDLFKSNQMEKISWIFVPTDYFIESDDKSITFHADESSLKELNEELQKITADLSVMKK